MPRIIAGRGGRTIRVTAQGGASRDLSLAPTSFTADGGMNIATLDRQGLTALTRRDGPKNKTLSFTLELGRVDWKQSIQAEIDWLQRRRDDGKRIKFSGMPKQFAGWWVIESAPIEVTQLTPSHQISRATINFSLIEHADYTARIMRQAPPRRTSGQSANRGVTRYHTVVSGDWLSKLSLRYYGSASKNAWMRIYNANRNRIKNPDLIHIGWRLKIPPK